MSDPFYDLTAPTGYKATLVDLENSPVIEAALAAGRAEEQWQSQVRVGIAMLSRALDMVPVYGPLIKYAIVGGEKPVFPADADPAAVAKAQGVASALAGGNGKDCPLSTLFNKAAANPVGLVTELAQKLGLRV